MRKDVLAGVGVGAALLGGAAGLLIGAPMSTAIASYAGWPTHVSYSAVVIGLTVSAVTGILAGLYPAMRAARLQPIDAVRYE